MHPPPPVPPEPPHPPVAHAAWQEARRAVLAALADGVTVVALCGAAGVGKTRLLRELEQALGAPGRQVARLDDGALVDPADLPPLLLVDEAERISDETLRALAQRRSGLVVLAGLPGLAARLADLPHRSVVLAPLRPQDVPAYVAARLAEVRLDGRRLAGGTLEALAAAARGVPGRLNLLAGTSFLAADIDGAAQVTPAHVHEAVAMHTDLAAEAPPWPDEPLPPAQPPQAVAEPGRALVPLPPPTPTPLPRRAGPWGLAVAAALLLAGGLGWLALRSPAGPALPPAAAVPSPAATALSGAAPGAPAAPPASSAPLAAATSPGAAAGSLVLPMAAEGTPAAALPPTDAVPPAEALPAIAEEPFAPVPAGTVPLPPVQPTHPAAGGAAALPPGVVPRLVVTYQRGTDPGAATALATGLAGAGWAAGEPFPVARASATAELRYFFLEDRAAALAVQALGFGPLRGATVRLQPVAGGLPRPGAIEATLPAAANTAPEAPAAEAPAPPPPPRPGATLLAPPEAAALAQRSLTLSWRAVPGDSADFVEVMEVQGDGTLREVFAAYAGVAGQQALRLDRPGLYAWRVLGVSAAAQRYTPSPWFSFTLSETLP